jgi:hypothetical protein
LETKLEKKSFIYLCVIFNKNDFKSYGLCADLRVSPLTIDYWGLAAFFWILNLGATSEDVILFGRSIGTGIFVFSLFDNRQI